MLRVKNFFKNEIPNLTNKNIFFFWYNSTSESEVAQSCPTLCDPMDSSLLGFSVHGIFEGRVLEWLPFSSPGDLPDPETLIAGRRFYHLTWMPVNSAMWKLITKIQKAKQQQQQQQQQNFVEK